MPMSIKGQKALSDKSFAITLKDYTDNKPTLSNQTMNSCLVNNRPKMPDDGKHRVYLPELCYMLPYHDLAGDEILRTGSIFTPIFSPIIALRNNHVIGKNVLTTLTMMNCTVDAMGIPQKCNAEDHRVAITMDDFNYLKRFIHALNK